jgi:hypothetical protein
MKKTLFLLLLTAMLGCRKTHNDKGDYKDLGIITATDMRMCACCGGYFIDINGTTHRFYEENLPPNNLSLSPDNLPMKVKLDWQEAASACGNELITVTRIAKAD